jgi:hypothetical protein
MANDGAPRFMGGVEPTLSFVEARSNSLSEALEVLRAGLGGPILEADSFEGSFGVKECERT